MIDFSKNVKTLRPSATVQMADHAADLRRRGKSIVSLAAGEPHFHTPDHIRRAAIDAIHAGRTQYTQSDGLYELRTAIAESVQTQFMRYSHRNIIVSAGAKQVIFNALMATLNPDDEVVVLAPYWISYKDIAEFCGARVKVVPWSSDVDFSPDLSALDQAISVKTKWMVLNSPNNPTGSVYSLETLERIAEVLRRHPQVWVISDEIYKEIVLENEAIQTFSQVSSDLSGRMLLVNGFSKGHCMTGWRVGYGAAHESLIQQMSKVQSQSTTNACTISQYAALAALDGSNKFIRENNVVYRGLRDLARAILGESDLIHVNRPGGGFYLLADVKASLQRRGDGYLIDDDVTLCRYMLDKTGVAVVPGSAFGAPGFIRVSFACDEQILRDGCTRIVTALSDLKEQ